MLHITEAFLVKRMVICPCSMLLSIGLTHTTTINSALILRCHFLSLILSLSLFSCKACALALSFVLLRNQMSKSCATDTSAECVLCGFRLLRITVEVRIPNNSFKRFSVFMTCLNPAPSSIFDFALCAFTLGYSENNETKQSTALEKKAIVETF